MSLQESIIVLNDLYERYVDANLRIKIFDFIKSEIPERLDLYISG